MKLLIAKDYNEMSKLAAEELASYVKQKPDSILGLATGGTPVGMYKELIKMNQNGIIDFSKIKTVNLDEYVGVKSSHEQSYRYFMNENLFNYINIDKMNTFVPNGMTKDIEKECLEYDKKINELGDIDLQLVGIGKNGHIGFNEPAEFLRYNTHLTNLKEDTIKANSRFFDSIRDVPRQAITMGIGNIMKSKKILLIASGEGKAEIIDKLINGDISTMVPASILKLHKDLVVIIDEDAAKYLNR